MANDFGSVLRAYRLARKQSRYALARISGVSSSSITRFEQNRYKPTPRNIQRLAAALDIPYSELLAAAGYTMHELPTLKPYLRAAYGMSEQNAADVERYIAENYGISPGPIDGEDELTEAA